MTKVVGLQQVSASHHSNGVLELCYQYDTGSFVHKVSCPTLQEAVKTLHTYDFFPPTEWSGEQVILFDTSSLF